MGQKAGRGGLKPFIDIRIVEAIDPLAGFPRALGGEAEVFQSPALLEDGKLAGESRCEETLLVGEPERVAELKAKRGFSAI